MRWNYILFGICIILVGIYGIAMGLTDFSRQWVGEMFWTRGIIKKIMPEPIKCFIKKMYLIGGIFLLFFGIFLIIYFTLN